MLQFVEIEEIYLSRTGIPFKVTGVAKHGQDCSQNMVIYENLRPTYDYPTGQSWVMEEKLFMRLFRENK